MHLIIIALVLFNSAHSEIEERYNPNEPCFCVTLKECPSLLQLLSIKPTPPKNIEYLTSKNCGYVQMEPKVCCPDIIANTINTPPPKLFRRFSTSLENNEDVPLYHKRHPPLHHHHSGFPYYGNRFHGKPLVPNFDELNPNEMQDTEAPTTQASIERWKLLPDETCGISLNHRIIGGKQASIGAYPWIARLGYTRPRVSVYLYRCGGALINSKYVLTAAHCIDDLPDQLKLATIRLGEQDERSDPDCEGDVCADPPQDFKPLVIIAHRNYNVPKYKNDIGLIRLDKEAIITPYVSPICLPHDFMKMTNYSGYEVTAAGWGTVNIDTSSSSPILQEVTLRIAHYGDCKTIYSSRFQIDIGEKQFCTSGQQGVDTCEGDSGGPLMRIEQIEKGDVPRHYLLGITSFGPKRCGSNDLPAVFTKVQSHLDWILYHIDDDFAVIS